MFQQLSKRAHVTLALVLGAVLACAGGGTEPPTGNARETIEVSLSANALVPGQPATATAVVRDDAGAVIPDAAVTWGSTNGMAASVAADGGVTALAPGGSTIVATRPGGASGSAAVSVAEGAWATPAGGTFAGFGGLIELQIPPAAVSAPRALHFNRASTALPDPTGVERAQFTVGTSADVFLVPATLRLRFTADSAPYGLPRSSLGIRVLQSDTWSNVPGSAIASGVDRAEAPISAGGHYGVGRLIPTMPCTDAAYRAFDFWLGDWDVSSGGTLVGRNRVTLEPGGCAVFEDYTSGPGGGRSISFYEPTSDAWYQTYLDYSGARLEISGPVGTPGSLRMRTVGLPPLYDRWEWTLLPSGEVTQVASRTLNNGVSFGAPYWNGLYRRRP